MDPQHWPIGYPQSFAFAKIGSHPFLGQRTMPAVADPGILALWSIGILLKPVKVVVILHGSGSFAKKRYQQACNSSRD